MDDRTLQARQAELQLAAQEKRLDAQREAVKEVVLLLINSGVVHLCVLFGGTAAVLCAQSMTQQQASEIPAWLVRIGLSGCTLQIGRHVLPFMLAAVRA